MVGLTLAPEGSGSLSKHQTVRGLHRLRSHYVRGCRIPDETGSKKSGSKKSLQVRRLVGHGT